jgi:ubiquinone/menaquinone biosynthesis C-methylase UbiE
MGVWSRTAGHAFIDWLAPATGLRWLDVGCGNGAFTEVIAQRCAPASIMGIDPSAAQLAFARTRTATRTTDYSLGDAMALAFPDYSFDAAVMALVIFFLPDPARGVAEMARVVSPGGMIAAYAWDMFGGRFPLEPIQAELRAIGIPPTLPPSAAASRMEALQELWRNAGLKDIRTHEIAVQRIFDDFDTFWAISLTMANLGTMLAALPKHEIATLQERVRKRLQSDATGRVICNARANAIAGRAP